MTREQKAWKSLCAGKASPKPAPLPVFVRTPEPPDPHPERLTDPHWARQPFRRGGKAEMFRRMGLLIEGNLEAHYALVESQAKHNLPPPHHGASDGVNV